MSSNNTNTAPPSKFVGMAWTLSCIPHNQKAGVDVDGDRLGFDHPWAGMWVVCPKDGSLEECGVYAASDIFAEAKAQFDQMEARRTMT